MSVGRPRLLSNADVARARELLRSGSATRGVAAMFAVDRRTIRRRVLRTPYKQQERRW